MTISGPYSAHMSKVEEIKTQIDALSWQERCELNALLQNWPEDGWTGKWPLTGSSTA